MTFTTHHALVNNVDIAYWHERSEGAHKVLVCVHGWPESKRIFSRVVEPLRGAGFDVVVPDLRGFGESGVVADGLYDVVSHARDIESLVFEHLGYECWWRLGWSGNSRDGIAESGPSGTHGAV